MFLQVCVCPQEGVVLSQHALQQVPGGGWYPSMPCRFPSPHPRGKFRGIWQGGHPGPHPRGKLKGVWSRPTAKEEVEGDLVKAHTQGGCWGGSRQGVPALGVLPAPGGACCGGVERATAAGGMYPTGMYSCLPVQDYASSKQIPLWLVWHYLLDFFFHNFCLSRWIHQTNFERNNTMVRNQNSSSTVSCHGHYTVMIYLLVWTFK